MLHDPKFWLAISFLIFLGLMIKYVWPILANLIDNKSKMIASEVALALEIKNKAQSLMVEAEKYQKEALAFSKKLVEDAKNEANSIIIDAKNGAEEEVSKKLSITMQRLNEEEEKIIRQVKTNIVDNAIKVISDNLISSDQNSSEVAVESAIDDLGKVVH